MSDDKKNVLKLFKKFKVIQVVVRESDIIGFLCQKIKPGAFECSEIITISWYPDDPEETRWSWLTNLGSFMSAKLTSVSKPSGRWVLLSNSGDVLVAGGGEVTWEKPDLTSKKVNFLNVKNLKSGEAVAVSSKQGLYKRESAGKWKKIGKDFKFHESEENYNTRLLDVASFSNEEIYAVGSNGNAWLYDGNDWNKLETGSNLSLDSIICAEDGRAYINLEGKQIVIGRKNEWRILDYVFEEFIIDMVFFDNRIFITTYSKIFEIKEDNIIESDLGFPEMVSYESMDAKDGVLVIACATSAHFYNGSEWTEIFKL